MDPFASPRPLVAPAPVAPTPPSSLRQRSMLDFYTPSTSASQPTTVTNTSSCTSLDGTQTSGTTTQRGTRLNERGHKFCKGNGCRYCPHINRTGSITSTTTGIKHHSMIHTACRSTNLVYAITCTRCGQQYVGQTLRKLKDRLSEHFRSIDKAEKDKPVGQHFSQENHAGCDDVSITVLEFIKKPPRSPEAIVIRNRVERNWTHMLRSLAPQGLNQENPKEYHSHRKQ